MEQTSFAKQLGGMYKKAMDEEQTFHVVSNLILLASMPFEKMMEDRGVSAEQILGELQTVARGILIQFATDGFEPLEISAQAVKMFPELHKAFMESNVRPTILDEAPEVVQ